MYGEKWSVQGGLLLPVILGFYARGEGIGWCTEEDCFWGILSLCSAVKSTMRRQCSTHECADKFLGQELLLLKIHPPRSLLIHYNNNSYPKLSAYNVPDPALSTLYIWFLISALWFKNKDLWSSSSKALADFWPCGLNHSTLRAWPLHWAGNPVLASFDSKHINLKCSLDSHPRSRQLSAHSVVVWPGVGKSVWVLWY